MEAFRPTGNGGASGRRDARWSETKLGKNSQGQEGTGGAKESGLTGVVKMAGEEQVQEGEK